MDLHFPRPERRDGRYQDDPPEVARDQLILGREHDQISLIQIHIDRFEPELVGQPGVVAEIADRAAMGEGP